MLAVVCPPGALTGWRRYGSEGLLAIYLFIPFVVEHNAFRNALFIVLFFALVAAFSASGSGASAFWRSRPLIFLGEISYSLYLTHTLTMTLETRFLALDGIRGESLWIRMGVILAMVLFVFVVAVLMYYSVEWPARLLSRRLADSSTARPILGGPLVSTVTVSS
jgi:peptidoglycan/LPS O-acetylase OafA/YrhL